MAGQFKGSLKDAVDEVLAWSSIFNFHPTPEDLIENLQVKTEPEQLIEFIEKSPKLSISNGVVISDKYPLNTELDKSKMLANEHIEQTKEVLSILNSAKQVTGLAITGSVAAGVNEEGGDVDILIITKPGWVWRVRALAIYLSHKHPKGRLLCPNMVLANDSLEFEQSVYGAREMMRIIPIKNDCGISDLYESNKWVQEILPNAKKKGLFEIEQKRTYPWWWSVMRLPFLGPIIENWEAKRRIKELTISKSDEAIYSKSVCRGHENAHKKRIEHEYSKAMEAI